MPDLYRSFFQAQQQLADIEAIDYFFAKEMSLALTVPLSEPLNLPLSQTTKLLPEQEQVLFHLLMCLSTSLRAGHTCLPITEIANINWGIAFDEQGQVSHQGYIFPNENYLDNLLSIININADNQQVIVFSHGLLYMRRYYQFETELAKYIEQRLVPQAINEDEVKNCLDTLFTEAQVTQATEATQGQQNIDWQKVAVANAINKNFAVIAGGPGTGKTYTVTKLLAALLILSKSKKRSNNEDDKQIQDTTRDTMSDIALVAPTGKAAQRLSESIINAIAGFKGLISTDVLNSIPTQAKTIHRLLGVIPNSPNFRHNQNNLLSCDVILIDEVSMVDLPMMTRIFRALKPHAKVILLGDADQLPSVAVGRVLADIAPRPHAGYSKCNSHYLAQVCTVNIEQLNNSFKQTSGHCDHLTFLTKSRRFDGEGGIGKIAAHVIKGEYKQSWQLLNTVNVNTKSKSKKSDNSNQLTLVNDTLSTWLTPLVKQYYQALAQCSTVTQAFELLAKFRILCVTRQGEFGVDTINAWVKEQLASNHKSLQFDDNYHGMPIMISENDYRLGLFNGDIGIIWQVNGHLMAHFETVDPNDNNSSNNNSEEHCQYKTLLPSRLPKYDSVYAMTIHKTQGSEFDHVVMLLPKQSNNNLLSRELLYTGITRAKNQLTIASNEQSWQQGVKSEVKRYSGFKI